MNSIVRWCAAALSAAALVFVAGCEPRGAVVVAQINNESISEKEYNLRVQSVTSIPESVNTDAGGLTMINIIRDKLTDQLAHQRHAVPSEQTVSDAAGYQLRMDPATNVGVTTGKVPREDLLRQKRYELEAFGIGTNGDKPSEQDIDKAYEEYKDKPELHKKAAYTAKILQVPDELTGRQVIEFLKKTGDFKGAAEKILRLPALDSTKAGTEQGVLSDQLRPELRQALDKLKPNEITPEPVVIRVSDPQQPMNTQSVFAVAQLKSKEPERTLSKSEVHFLLEPLVLQKTHPEWKEHYRRELADFTRKSQIRVAIQRYADLVDTYVMPRADAETARTPAGLPPSQSTGPLR